VKPFDAVRAHWDRALALGMTVVGLVMLVVGYFRISDTPYPAEQLPLLMSAGVGSLFLLGVGATLWLSADLRDEWHKLDELTENPDEVARGTAVPNGELAEPVDAVSR
jgi:multisubunit Na+/H+ antiporter MnhB subunit